MGIGANVQKIAQKEDISLKELSRRAGIPYTTVYNMVKRDSDRISPENVQKLADALEVSISELYGPEFIFKTVQQIAHKVAEDTAQTFKEQKKKLNNAFAELNYEGREEAVKRIQELAFMPQYSYKPYDKAERAALAVAQAVADSAGQEELDRRDLNKDKIAFMVERILREELPEYTPDVPQLPTDSVEDTDTEND